MKQLSRSLSIALMVAFGFGANLFLFNRNAASLLEPSPESSARWAGMHLGANLSFQKANGSKPEREVKLEKAEGGQLSLSELKGKTAVFVLCSKGSADTAGELMQAIDLATANEKDGAYYMAMDLRSLPGMFRGQLRGKVKGELQKKKKSFQDSFEKAGTTYEERNIPVFLLDWGGALSKEFGVKGNLDAACRVVVLNRKGEPQPPISVPNMKSGVKPNFEETIKEVQKLMSAKSDG